MTPTYSSSVDYDSNRLLSAQSRGSEAAVLTADLLLDRALENTDISIEPRYAFRRYSNSSLGNGDDRSIAGKFRRSRELTRLDLSASYWDQSTLVSEALETGIVRADTHRRLAQAAGTWSWSQTELWLLTAQFAYQDVSYYGGGQSLLPGYRYPSASVGEQFSFSERGSFTFSAFGSQLRSDTRGNSSRESGLQAEVIYAFSERTRIDAALAESIRVLAGASSHGTDASVTATHDYVRGSLSLIYTRSLVPYGFGYLVERQQGTLSASRKLTEYLDANVSVFKIENNQQAVLLEVDRRSYDTATAGLNWHPAETWNLGVQVAAVRTQTVGFPSATVKSWRGAVTLSWNPRRHAISR